ncbi:hypothetical protein MASR2M48_31900 [Spirochaetota bacterium]
MLTKSLRSRHDLHDKTWVADPPGGEEKIQKIHANYKNTVYGSLTSCDLTKSHFVVK